MKSLVRVLFVVLSWLPFLVFFSILIFMFLTDFQNPTDEYFVSLILRACLMLLASALLSQSVVLAILLVKLFLPARRRSPGFDRVVQFFDTFPIVDIGIFSIAIFFTSPEVGDWVPIVTSLLVFSTFSYWWDFLKGPIRNLYVFARFHQVRRRKINQVMAPFYAATFVNFFFLVLKRHLMPLVFILVVMDFRIILPRLVDAGLSYQAFVLFLSLIISLHVLSYRREIV